MDADTLDHEVILNKSNLLVDGRVVANTNYDDIPNLDRTIKLFASNHVNMYVGNRYIYWCKFWNMNDELVRDFVPCRTLTQVKNVEGVTCNEGNVGFYDLVEGKFYSTQGSGDFIAGPEVNE